MGTIINTSYFPNSITRLGSVIDLSSTDVTGVLPVSSGGTESDTISGATSNLNLLIGQNVQAYSANLDTVGQLYATGVVNGGIISINTDNTLIDITPGTGYIVDNYTNPLSPVVNTVNWGSFGSIATEFLSSTIDTQLLINSGGGLVQLSTIPTADQLRDYIYLGKVVHSNLSANNAVVIAPRIVYDSSTILYDLIDSLGPIVVNGLYVGFYDSTLSLVLSAGNIFRLGANYGSSMKTPNIVHIDQQSPMIFQYRYRNGSGSFTTSTSTSVVDPGHVDNGTGTLSAVGNNQWTIQRIYVSTAGTKYLTYGQAVYASLANAIDSIPVEMPVIDIQFKDMSLRAYLAVKGNATDLSNTTNNKITLVGKLSLPIV